jgi:hypothetical protein
MKVVFTSEGVRLLHEIVRDEYRRCPEEVRKLCRAIDRIRPPKPGCRSMEWLLDNEILPYQAEMFSEEEKE